jgi:hypothetical protein
MQTKNYIVALKKDVDYAQFWTEIESQTTGIEYIPDRAVHIDNNRDAFRRICQYALTDAEADLLRQDPRVAGVELPLSQRTDIKVVPHTIQTDNFNKPPASGSSAASGGTHVNWGLIRHSNATNVYGTSDTTSLNYEYVLNGVGVDMVITDSGIDASHPEFQYPDSVLTRVQFVDWANYVPALSSMANPYEDPDGHGTHVCGIAAGKTYGWAKNSLIYSLVATGVDAADPMDMFDAIKQWHEAKGATGMPTVMNMSWGYAYSYSIFDPDPAVATDIFLSLITSVTYRGTTYPGNTNVTNYGVLLDSANPDCVDSFTNGFPARDIPSDVALEELIDSGVIVCRSAGNNSYKIDVPGGLDYDNYITTVFGDLYYQQGSSPWAEDAIVVGSLDATTYSSLEDQKATYSCAGPGVDVYAAGTNILSATTSDPLAFKYAISNVYFLNNNFRQLNIGGTSMASPQIAGISALYLEANQLVDNLASTNSAQVKSWASSVATSTMYAPGNSSSYLNFESTLGGNGLVAYQPYAVNPADAIEVYVGGFRVDTGYTVINLDPVYVKFDEPPPDGIQVTILVRRGVWWYDVAVPDQSLQETDTPAARFLRGG